MLTPEQTRLRIQDNEMRALRAENARLEKKLADARSVVKEFVLLIAEKMPYSYKVKLTEMCKELDTPTQ